MAVQLQKRMLTVNEYHRMAETGIFSEDERIELIDGEIIDMTPIGSRHVACVNRLNKIFMNILGDQVIIQVQSPINLGGYSEPEPDIALLKYKADYYVKQLPESKDVLLIVEVSDTSLEYDREIKLPSYATAHIAEVWIVNLQEGYIEVHTEPSKSGYCKMLKKFGKDEQVTSTVFHDLEILVKDIIG